MYVCIYTYVHTHILTAFLLAVFKLNEGILKALRSTVVKKPV